MLEIRPTPEGFILFDTDEQEAIMRFDSREEAAELVAELVIAESSHGLGPVIRPVVSRTERR
ncbi:hypothetical protein [Rhodanobacter sp. A1T4]|uniref:hypothetical protein n=1 Tax=Rhodanobacter sp. A1T4 TaxID=2723087 RepID=UPI0016138B94|nr:hypothetical protein [Rhodanobacter sp. A1T4]MBB6249001.1 hypothetical protein [Rhodanobacter sp. A1T4]